MTKNKRIDMKYGWDMLKMVVPNLLLVAVLILSIYIFHLHTWQVLLAVVGLKVVTAGYRYIRYKEFTPKKTIKGIIISVAFLTTILYMYKWIGAYSLLGVGVVTLIITAYLVYKGRKQIVQTIKDVETTIWGKSLDKDNWKKK